MSILRIVLVISSLTSSIHLQSQTILARNASDADLVWEILPSSDDNEAKPLKIFTTKSKDHASFTCPARLPSTCAIKINFAGTHEHCIFEINGATLSKAASVMFDIGRTKINPLTVVIFDEPVQHIRATAVSIKRTRIPYFKETEEASVSGLGAGAALPVSSPEVSQCSPSSKRFSLPAIDMSRRSTESALSERSRSNGSPMTSPSVTPRPSLRLPPITREWQKKDGDSADAG